MLFCEQRIVCVVRMQMSWDALRPKRKTFTSRVCTKEGLVNGRDCLLGKGLNLFDVPVVSLQPAEWV
jgi:hypothetical protein